MPIKNAIHSQQVYDPTDDSIMAEQELCMERLLEQLPNGYATIMCRMDLNEIVSRNLKELKTFCTFTRQKKAVRDIPFDAPLYSRGNSPHLTMSIQHIRM